MLPAVREYCVLQRGVSLYIAPIYFFLYSSPSSKKSKSGDTQKDVITHDGGITEHTAGSRGCLQRPPAEAARCQIDMSQNRGIPIDWVIIIAIIHCSLQSIIY